ncbi:MAG TPA: MASE4 domain-containing protein [Bradyrhizobium sp.]|nr:MASE4 domain-containing protein [Bradyrhizobium sp.]
MEVSGRQQFLLATLPPSRGQTRLASGVAAALLVAFLVAAPFATVQLPRVDGFVAASQSVYAVNDLITSALIMAQFAIVRRWALFALAMGFLYTALIAFVHALAFPGAFTPPGFFGAGVQTTAWLYNFWKAGLPLAVIAWSLLKDDAGATSASPRSPAFIIVAGVAAVVALVAALTWSAIAGERFLPSLLSADGLQYDQRTLRLFGVLQEALCIGALLLLWLRRNCMLDIWLLVLSFTLVLEVTMSSLLAAGRFDVGWYVSRLFALTASLVVLIVLLSEITTLYANLARSVLRQRAAREARQVAMDAMAASIAHEINQPLAAIALNGEAALMCLAGPAPDLDEARDAVRSVVDDSHRASAVIGGIRSMYRSDRHGRTWLDVDGLVREALAAAGIELRAHRVAVAVEPHDALPRVFADRGQLQQVFHNLIMNAIEAMHGTAEHSRTLRMTSDVARDASQIVVSIADSGAGIGEQDKARIFEPFFTTKSTGTGIGLTICRSIIESHGGVLQASANRPSGTIFEVVLPVEAAG